MTTDETIAVTVRETLARVLARDIAPGETVSREDEPNWDSLMHVEILFELEDAFAVRFEEDEMPDLDSLKKLVASIESHRAA